jgi:hypothetical protein
MDFDHREANTKSFWVLQRAGAVSRERLEAEIAKCDIVCANCHRARTYQRAMELRRLRSFSGHPPTLETRLRREQTELIQRLRDVPCSDCGQRFAFYAMDFDHRGCRAKRAPRFRGCWGASRRSEFGRDREMRHRLCELPSDPYLLR